MKKSIKTGISFGITSGTITTLGLMMGLFSSTGSKMVVIGGILTIAIADSMADALGIHVSKESENKLSRKRVWTATLATFLSKSLYTLSFIIPLLVFGLWNAIVVSIVYGLLMLSLLSYKIGKDNREKPFRVVFEHLVIAIIVLILSYYAGVFVGNVFG